MTDVRAARPRAHPFPMIRGGGLFVLCVGLGITLGTLLGGGEPVRRPLFYLGIAAGVAALSALGGRLAYGAPTRGQVAALVGAIALEVLLFAALSLLPGGRDARTDWLLALLIVGVHFLPMAFAFGPPMALLGGLCIANAAAGLRLGAVPFALFGVMDGLLKIAIGLAMARARPARPA